MPLPPNKYNKQSKCRMSSLYTLVLWDLFLYVTMAHSLMGNLIRCLKKLHIEKVLHMDANQFHNTELFSIGVSVTVMTVPGLILFIVP